MSLLWTHLVEVAFALTATSSPTPVNCVKTTLRACAASALAKSGWRGLRCEKPIRWIPQASRKDTVATARATEPMLSYCPGTRRPPTKSPSPATAGAMHGSAVNKVTDKKHGLEHECFRTRKKSQERLALQESHRFCDDA